MKGEFRLGLKEMMPWKSKVHSKNGGFELQPNRRLRRRLQKARHFQLTHW